MNTIALISRPAVAFAIVLPAVNHDGDDAVTPGLYFSHPACLEHDPRVHSPGHPDTPERLVALERALGERDWLGWERREAPAADESHLELVHAPAHVARIRELCARGGGAIDADTFVGEPSFRAALHAAGGACEMVRALLAGEGEVGLLRRAPVRPPRRSGQGDGLLPVQQRRDRGG